MFGYATHRCDGRVVARARPSIRFYVLTANGSYADT